MVHRGGLTLTTSPRLLTDHLSFPRGRAAADIPALARQSFPLCMSNMYKVGQPWTGAPSARALEAEQALPLLCLRCGPSVWPPLAAGAARLTPPEARRPHAVWPVFEGMLLPLPLPLNAPLLPACMSAVALLLPRHSCCSPCCCDWCVRRQREAATPAGAGPLRGRALLGPACFACHAPLRTVLSKLVTLASLRPSACVPQGIGLPLQEAIRFWRTEMAPVGAAAVRQAGSVRGLGLSSLRGGGLACRTFARGRGTVYPARSWGRCSVALSGPEPLPWGLLMLTPGPGTAAVPFCCCRWLPGTSSTSSTCTTCGTTTVSAAGCVGPVCCRKLINCPWPRAPTCPSCARWSGADTLPRVNCVCCMYR